MIPTVAVFYDWLNQWGGAEKVLLDILSIYPQAELFTLVHDPLKTPWLPKNIKINTSFINHLPGAKNNPIIYTPLYDIALEQFDFSPFNIIISTTSTIGHCLLTPPTSLFICYYHNINRHLYFGNYPLLQPLLKIFRHFDFIYSRRPDYSFCNSHTVRKRIQKYFKITPRVINPGIDTTFFSYKPTKKSDYFLIVSRLVPHKNIDIAVRACQQLHLNLKIIGTGRQLNYLKSISNPEYIEFLGQVSDTQLRQHYRQAMALICPQVEDFGLTPLEANSCGTPVIALKKGGIADTVIENQTGIFFSHQTVTSLAQALKNFKTTNFDPANIRRLSLHFSHKVFMLHFRQTINRLWQKHQTTI